MVATPIYAPGLFLPGISPVPISITKYLQTVGLNEYLFYGVKRGAYVPETTQFYDIYDRQMIYQYLRMSERQIENKIRVRLFPTWIDEEGEEVIVADMRGFVSASGSGWQGFASAGPWSGRRCCAYYNPTGLDWKHFIQAGQMKRSVYAAHGTVVYSGDWATVTVPSGGVGIKSEIRVYYADGMFSPYAPEPTKIKVGPNNIIITFPKVRMVKPELSIRPYIPLDFDVDSNFVETVTVAREYNDPSTQAVVRTLRNCRTGCQETFETGCIFPSQRELGYVAIYPACYAGGQWRRRTTFLGTPEVAFLHYQSGLRTLPAGWDQAIIRLAHTLMPEAPCPTGHQPQDRFWERDRNNSQSMTRERINCPWGTMDGAWYAWMFFEEQAQNYSKGGGLLAFRG